MVWLYVFWEVVMIIVLLGELFPETETLELFTMDSFSGLLTARLLVLRISGFSVGPEGVIFSTAESGVGVMPGRLSFFFCGF